MSDIKTTLNEWMKKGKGAWADTLQTIRALDISTEEAWGQFFAAVRDIIINGAEFEQMLEQDQSFRSFSLEHLQKNNLSYFAEIVPGADSYEICFANPDYAAAKFGLQTGQLVSLVYSALRDSCFFARIGNYTEMSECNKLFLNLYELWQHGNIGFENSLDAYKSYLFSNMEMSTLLHFYRSHDPEYTLYKDILESSDFADVRYLYRFGAYVKPEILKMAEFIAAYPESDLRNIAKHHVNAYLQSFERKNQDYRKKKYARVIYPMGMERLALMMMQELAAIGLTASVGAPAVKGANEQYSYDLRFSMGLYFDQQYADKRFSIISDALAKMEKQLKLQAGPLVILLFGEKPFVPVIKNTTVTMSEEQDKIQHQMQGKTTRLFYQTAPREETSFSMIAFPSTEIGDNFAAIFTDTLELNMLDNMHYAKIQQFMIDILDQADYVHIKGVDGNETDLRVQFQKIADPSRETLFENCVADVNIPVGEVFTTPKLTGTEGVLHVADTFLAGLRFFNLKLNFKDGMITEYSCSNFSEESENRKYIFDNLLKPNKSLPIGEFAIGTNTKAYRMAHKYDIHHLLPILITEKMGPHFAIGDTCYSYEEDSAHHSLLSKKLIISTENEKSSLRKTDPAQAYTHKHIDITLPYDMLAEISAVKTDGTRIPIISNGLFAVAGTEELNIPLQNP
ncbi:MAG: aminopeptidase [Candidatus Riflebacteria bacterium]|nr:aminopeptidase [Candidatus Riflebacteria bacterium]